MKVPKNVMLIIILAIQFKSVFCIEVNIKGLGIIRGISRNVTSNNNLVDSFLGIPFAKPPIGKLRFAPPVEPVPWKGIRNSTMKFCPQQNPLTKKFFGQEDCLYLNIYRARKDALIKKPVMVFIHGGDFVRGSASDYSGEVLAVKTDVVVVTINYRLGVLGFFNTPGTKTAGNYGLLDQIKALEWVKSYIGYFGGDKDKVTVFGESAGAGCLTLLMLSPLSKGLFSRAIAESGSALNVWAIWERQGGKASQSFGKSLGCTSSATVTECLRGKSQMEILQKQSKLPQSDGAILRPTVDGQVIRDFPFKQAQDGKLPIADIDLVIGFNKDEGTRFALATRWNKAFFRSLVRSSALVHYSKDIELVTELASFEYDHHRMPENVRYSMSTNKFMDQYYFKEGIINLANEWSKGGKNTFLYDFTHVPEHARYPDFGVAHAMELSFVFGTPFLSSNDPIRKSDTLIANFTKQDEIVSAEVMKMWANFAKNGVPHVKWPKFNASQKMYLEINNDTIVRNNYNPRMMEFWNKFVPQIIKLGKNETVSPCMSSGSKRSNVMVLKMLWVPLVTFTIYFRLC